MHETEINSEKQIPETKPGSQELSDAALKYKRELMLNQNENLLASDYDMKVTESVIKRGVPSS